eukprot:gene15289-18102_t
MDECFKVFSQTSISDIIKKDTLVAVNKTASVEEVLKVLHQHSLTSAPIIDPDTGRNRVIGFVDTNDVLALLVRLCEKVDVANMELRLLSIAFLHTSVSNIMDLSKKDQFVVCLEEQSILEVLKLYAKGIHRVALLSVFSDIEDINTTIRDLLPILVGPEEVVTVNHSDLAIESFRKMNQRKVTAVPVLNETQQVVGTLSINDLSGLNEDNIDLLLQSTDRFISRNNDIEPNKNKPSHPIVITLDQTFREAIKMLSEYKVHRPNFIVFFNEIGQVFALLVNPTSS